MGACIILKTLRNSLYLALSFNLVKTAEYDDS